MPTSGRGSIAASSASSHPGCATGVVVQNGEKRSARFAECLIHSRSETDVRSFAITRTPPRGSMRSVRYCSPRHFKIRKVWRSREARQCVQRFVRRERRNNHGHRWVDLAGPRFLFHFRLCKPQANMRQTYDRIVACIDTYSSNSRRGGPCLRKPRRISAKSGSLTNGGENAEAYWAPDGTAHDFSVDARQAGVRSDFHHESRRLEPAHGFHRQRPHHLRIFPAGQQAHSLRLDA